MKSFITYLREENQMVAKLIEEVLNEAAPSKINNTDAADVNEIMLGYYLLGGTWSNFNGSNDAKSQLKEKSDKVGKEVADVQTKRAEMMAKEVIAWSRNNGYNGKVKQVWWTARPGVLAKAVGQDVNSRKNPTDVLIQFTDNEFLGVSAKSTKTTGDIGFKNPGIGTVSKNLNIVLDKFATEAVNKLLKQYPDLSSSASTRKREIRADKNISKTAEELGTKVLNSIRDELYKKLRTMNDSDIKEYLLNDWLDAKNAVYPRYVKVTGMRNAVKIEDPMANSKIAALSSYDVSVSKIGNDSVGIMAGTKRIMKMRAKFESQKLASSVKFSGDPWK